MFREKKGLERNASFLNAAKHGNLTVVRRLLEEGANIEARTNWSSKTALTLAAKYGHLNVVKQLLEEGANIEARTNWSSKTALTLAAKYGHLNVVKQLLEKGANIEVTDWNNDTVLMRAVNTGRLDVVKLLMEHGANIKTTNEWGETALILAEESDNREIYNFLKSFAKITLQDGSAQIPHQGSVQEKEAYLAGKFDIDFRHAVALNKLSNAEVMTKQGIFPAPSSSSEVPVTKPATEEIPDEFICPITQEMMTKPMICTLDVDGISYEEKNIKEWLSKNRTSPIGRLPMKPDQKIEDVLIVNINLKAAIETFRQNNLQASPMRNIKRM